jgi:hypothetical protein
MTTEDRIRSILSKFKEDGIPRSAAVKLVCSMPVAPGQKSYSKSDVYKIALETDW